MRKKFVLFFTKACHFFSLLNKTEFSPLLFAVQRYFSSLSFCLFRHKKIHCNCKQNVPKNQRYHRFSIPPRDFQLGWLDGKIAFPKKPKHYFSKKVANCIAKEPHTVGFNIHLRFVRSLYVEFWLRKANESQFWNVNAQNVRLYFACIM